ncbi:MAG: 2-deoxyribose-5-phosphate aldolase, partial [Deltaproteobacteria bacterium]|nr:2-deoxyribose-5-phosphate aldolase [Deltaproteobacteria bacterium]
GGIKDLETARVMIRAGAARIGTSSGIQIVEELLYGRERLDIEQ